MSEVNKQEQGKETLPAFMGISVSVHTFANATPELEEVGIGAVNYYDGHTYISQ